MIESGSREFRFATLALCLGSAMIFANLHVVQSLLPTLAQQFQLSELQASWSLTITVLTLGLSLLVYGPLSDAIGRKPIMVVTMAGAVLVTLGLSQVESYPMLLLLRGLQGFFLGGLPAIAIAYMGDEFTRKAVVLAVGVYISANSLGGVTGRILGGFVGEHYGWAAAFAATGLLSALIVAVFVLLLPKSQHFHPKPLHPLHVAQDMGGHLRNPVLLAAFLIAFGNFMVFLNQYSYITFVLADAPYHLSPHALGMLFLTYLTGSFAAAISGRIVQYLSAPVGMALGILFLMAGSLLTLMPSLSAIVWGFMVSSFGFFLTHSLASGWVSQHALQARASASSLYLVFYYMGASAGGFVLAPFWAWQGWLGIVVGSLLVYSLTLGCALWLQRWQASGQRALA
ncbi:MAG TPA: MFS transporter [Candidatus Thiothrix moscowensis]|uniref:MFS transporter n=1 Tax=unclassified Thiothrix TaxID=2636184 RepID=UPI0025E5260C|nr:MULTISPECIES: MFS transporter [unclassified Thiothrix]HRJ52163.1 MFS transporter [Candidatus Thiothrix moscowensis]HRJ92326.1 MFS transporter [Candidatus Thiothrix moscowensis]